MERKRKHPLQRLERLDLPFLPPQLPLRLVATQFPQEMSLQVLVLMPAHLSEAYQ
jgi:hypothetical protein